MTSPIRPLLSSLLCCVIVFGHAPAWLHVATCDSEFKVSAFEMAQGSETGEKPVAVCSHGCHHHAEAGDRLGDQVNLGDEVNGEPSNPLHQHDSDTCVICQSLASSGGSISLALMIRAPEHVCEHAQNCADRLPVEAAIAIAHPRGPPVVA